MSDAAPPQAGAYRFDDERAQRVQRKLQRRKERAERRRRQLAAALIEADNEQIEQQREILAALEPANRYRHTEACLFPRYAHTSAMFRGDSSTDPDRRVCRQPLQSMHELTREFLGMPEFLTVPPRQPDPATAGSESSGVEAEHGGTDEQGETRPAHPDGGTLVEATEGVALPSDVPSPSAHELRSSVSMSELVPGVGLVGPSRSSRILDRLHADPGQSLSPAGSPSLDEDSVQPLVLPKKGDNDLASFREKVFDRRRKTSGRRHSLSTTAWPDMDLPNPYDPQPTGPRPVTIAADVFGAPGLPGSPSLEQPGQDPGSPPPDFLGHPVGSSTPVRPRNDLSAVLARRRSASAQQLAPRPWHRLRPLFRRSGVPDADQDRSGDADTFTDVRLESPRPADGEQSSLGAAPAAELPADDAADPESSDLAASTLEEPPSPAPRSAARRSIPAVLQMPPLLQGSAFDTRGPSPWSAQGFFSPYGAFLVDQRGMILPGVSGTIADTGPVAVPPGIGRRVLYPSTALFRNVLVQHADEQEGWGWEMYTNTSRFFAGLEADDSDSDDDEPLMDVRIHAREQRLMQRRIDREHARQRRALRKENATSVVPGQPDVDVDLEVWSENSSDENESNSETDPDAPWRDDRRPVGKLYGKSLMDVALTQAQVRAALRRFYGQEGLAAAAGEVARSGDNDTRERMARVFGPLTQWGDELIRQLQREAQHAHDPEERDRRLAELQVLLQQRHEETLARLHAATQLQEEQAPTTPVPRAPKRYTHAFSEKDQEAAASYAAHIRQADAQDAELVAAWHDSSESEEEGSDEEDDLPLATLRARHASTETSSLETPDPEEEEPLGELHPQAAIIAEQAALIKQLMEENRMARMTMGMFGLGGAMRPQPPSAPLPVPPWLASRPASSAGPGAYVDDPDNALGVDMGQENHENTRPEALPADFPQEYPGDYSSGDTRSVSGVDPAVAVLMDPTLLDNVQSTPNPADTYETPTKPEVGAYGKGSEAKPKRALDAEKAHPAMVDDEASMGDSQMALLRS